MKKRVLSALLAAALSLSLAVPALAAAGRDEAAEVLSALDILTGDENGELHLSSPVTRAEFVKMLMAASPISVGDVTYVSPYPDVPASHWAAPYVEAAVSAGYVTGYLDGAFRPGHTITLAEGVVMVLRLLGYTSSDFSGSFPAGQMSMYRTLDLDEGITLGPNDTMTRQDAMYLFYNLLTATSKTTGQPYLSSVLGHSLTADGKVDTLALFNETMDGPVVVGETGWRDQIPFDISQASVTRDGAASTPDALVNNDVVYWSKHTQSLWVYTNKVTGPLQSISPASSPTSVTVSGKSYEIGTTAAAYALSDLGVFEVGDAVTLLLGRDGRVVSAVDPERVSGGAVVGLVISVEPQTFTDQDGNDYISSSIQVLATDGATYTYSTSRNFRVGALVQVTTTTTGVEVKVLASASLIGQVDSAGTRLGNYPFAADVEILDIYGDRGVQVYPSRLAGMEITRSMVRYYLLNSAGEISRLVLSDATGDMHTYGVITSVREASTDLMTAGNYDYVAGGASGTLTTPRLYHVQTGPFLMKTDGADVDRLENLTRVYIDSVDGMTAYADNQQYAIWDDVLVYEVRDNEYYLTSLSLVAGGGYNLTGWYDKAESEGGRIRVILAR